MRQAVFEWVSIDAKGEFVISTMPWMRWLIQCSFITLVSAASVTRDPVQRAWDPV